MPRGGIFSLLSPDINKRGRFRIGNKVLSGKKVVGAVVIICIFLYAVFLHRDSSSSSPSFSSEQVSSHQKPSSNIARASSIASAGGSSGASISGGAGSSSSGVVLPSFEPGPLQHPKFNECKQQFREIDPQPLLKSVSEGVAVFGSTNCPCTKIVVDRFGARKLCFYLEKEHPGSVFDLLKCIYDGKKHHSFVFVDGKFVGNGFAFAQDSDLNVYRRQALFPTDEHLDVLLAHTTNNYTCATISLENR